MKSYDSDDELERSLFALELEEPPAGLRESILAGTVYRQPVTMNPWEMWSLAGLCALLVWVAVLLVHGTAQPAFSVGESYIGEALATLAKPQMLLWIAVGAGMVLWISQLNLTPVPGALRATRR